MCTGTPILHEQAVRDRVARPGKRIWRVCTSTPVQYEQTVRLTLNKEGVTGPAEHDQHESSANRALGPGRYVSLGHHRHTFCSLIS